MTRPWKVVDQNGNVVMAAQSVTAAAKLERTTPYRIAAREARLLVNVGAGDEPLRAVPAGYDE